MNADRRSAAGDERPRGATGSAAESSPGRPTPLGPPETALGPAEAAGKRLSARKRLRPPTRQAADEVRHRDLPHRAQLRGPPDRQPAPGHSSPCAPRGADTRGTTRRPAASPAAGDTSPVRSELVLPEQLSPAGGQPARLRSRTRRVS